MQNKEIVIPSVKKCWITTNVDRTENNAVNIQGLYGYIMPSFEAEYHLENENEDDEKDADDGDGMAEDEDDKTNGDYKIGEGGDIKHLTLFIEHFTLCYILVYQEHNSHWSK